MPLILNGTTGVSGVDGSAGTPSYQGTDTNTGIFYPAADTIAFAEGGAEIARFDSSGNLGIGTSIPNIASGFTNLVVSDTDNGGIVYVDRAGGARGYFYANGTSSVVLGNTSSIPLVFNTADTERMRIDSSGNVGIGTNNPSGFNARTAIRNDSGTCLNLSSTGNGARVVFENIGTDAYGIGMPSGTGALAFFSSNVTERMRITSGGNVLVGTTTAPVQHTSTAGSIVATGSINSFSGNVGNTTTGTSYNLFTAVAGASYIVNINAANTCSVYLVTCEVSSSVVTNTPLLIQNGANVTNSGTTIRFTNNFGGNLNNVGWSAIRLI